jgi:hypothetical protein
MDYFERWVPESVVGRYAWFQAAGSPGHAPLNHGRLIDAPNTGTLTPVGNTYVTNYPACTAALTASPTTDPTASSAGNEVTSSATRAASTGLIVAAAGAGAALLMSLVFVVIILNTKRNTKKIMKKDAMMTRSDARIMPKFEDNQVHPVSTSKS